MTRQHTSPIEFAEDLLDEDPIKLLREFIPTLLNLIELLANDDPCTSSHEGLDDGCFFCGGYIHYDDNARVATHEQSCAWVGARILMGHPIAPHMIKAPKPLPVETRRFHDPLIGF